MVPSKKNEFRHFFFISGFISSPPTASVDAHSALTLLQADPWANGNPKRPYQGSAQSSDTMEILIGSGWIAWWGGRRPAASFNQLMVFIREGVALSPPWELSFRS